MEETIVNNLEDLISKKVKVYFVDGLAREGILESRKNRMVKLISKNDQNEDKIILFNLDNISIIEEQ